MFAEGVLILAYEAFFLRQLFLQVSVAVHVGSCHWAALEICVSDNFDNIDVCLYDSAYMYVDSHTLDIIAQLVQCKGNPLL